jgi:hypothetical protein
MKFLPSAEDYALRILNTDSSYLDELIERDCKVVDYKAFDKLN